MPFNHHKGMQAKTPSSKPSTIFMHLHLLCKTVEMALLWNNLATQTMLWIVLVLHCSLSWPGKRQLPAIIEAVSILVGG